MGNINIKGDTYLMERSKGNSKFNIYSHILIKTVSFFFSPPKVAQTMSNSPIFFTSA